MPTPIIHLCVAKELLDVFDIHDKPNYYLGSISPDAMYLTPTYYDLEGYEEQYIKTHLAALGHSEREKEARNFIANYRTGKDGDFYFGYGIHLLTDVYWREVVYPKYEQMFSGELQHDELRTQFYEDARHFDLAFYEKFKLGADVWGYLEKSTPFDVNDLLTVPEIERWKDNVLALFDEWEKPATPVNYFTDDIIMDLINGAVDKISALYDMTD